jgi:anti-sigma-K factor RskA
MAEHLAERCDECETELRSLRETLAAFAISTASDGSADRIWQRIESRLRAARRDAQPDIGVPKDRPAHSETDRTQRPVRTTGVSRGWRIATVAVTAMAIMLAVMTDNYATRMAMMRQHDSARLTALNRQVRWLAHELEDRNQELATLHDQVSISGQLTQAVLSSDVQMIRLAPLASSPNAVGFVAVTRSRHHAVLEVVGLPMPPPGKEYELWWIGSKSGPVRAAVFAPRTSGDATVASPLPPAREQLLASAITLESAGGVDKPTGAMYLKGAP